MSGSWFMKEQKFSNLDPFHDFTNTYVMILKKQKIVRRYEFGKLPLRLAAKSIVYHKTNTFAKLFFVRLCVQQSSDIARRPQDWKKSHTFSWNYLSSNVYWEIFSIFIFFVALWEYLNYPNIFFWKDRNVHMRLSLISCKIIMGMRKIKICIKKQLQDDFNPIVLLNPSYGYRILLSEV